jgi:Bacterial Alpha-2-macroglobulin MG10 domain/Alpha-2-macroglobulin family/MG2 domain/Tetratricopeptide repeat
MNCSRLPFVLVLCAICQLPVQAAPREADWAKVTEATKNKHPKTAASLLSVIERKALADKAFAEGAKALAMRVALENQPAQNSPDAVRQLAAEIRRAPVEARPVLTLLEAKWLLSWYDENQSKVDHRSAADLSGQDEIETWDRARMLAEIDRRFRSSLADREILKTLPIAGFDALLDKGDLGDDLRPTLFDFLAHEAIRFYSMGETSGRIRFQESFDFTADSPALARVDDFLAWKPEPPTPNAPQFQALRLYQDLLEFHRNDPDPSAFLHCDLQRIRWAGEACVPVFDKPDPLDAALRAFIHAHADSPESADARIDVADNLIKKNRTKEAYEIVKAGAEAFPDHPFGNLCRGTMKDLEDRQCQVMMPSHWTGSGEQITVEHANVSRIWFRVYQQSWKPDVNTVKRGQKPWSTGLESNEEDKFMASLLRGKPAKAWDAALPDDHDFATRITHLPIPSDLPPGYYVLIASGSPGFELKNNFVNTMGVFVTQYSMVTRNENGRLSGFVTHARTGAPAPGVPVNYHMFVEEKKKLESHATKTDSDGWFSFLRQKEDSSDVAVSAGMGNDRVIQQPWASFGYSEVELPEPEEFVEWITDREIYRPGGTIQFKGIWFHADAAKQKFRTLSGKKTRVALSDPNGKEIAELKLISNEYGSFSGSFVLPAGGLNGIYWVSADDCGRQTSVRVEEYKRPKFSAAFDPCRTGGTIGKPVTVTGRARAFTGAPMDGAIVRWSVSRTIQCVEADYYRILAREIPIASGVTSSATDGSFSITFPALPDGRIDPDSKFVYAYLVKADVTDPAGETRSLESTIHVKRSTLEATLSADDWLQSDRPVALKIRTATADDVGQAAEGILKIHKLKEPEICPRGGLFERMLENTDAEVFRPVQSAQPARWELAESVAEFPVKTLADPDAGQAAGETNITTSLPAGAYRAVYATKDGNGRVVEAVRNFQVIDPKSERFPSKYPFFVVRDSEKAESGKALSLLWGSGHPEARACVEWFRHGKLLKREWSAPGRTQQCFTFTPDDSMYGGFEVHVTQSTMNAHYEYADVIEVPCSNKTLDLRWERIRSKLQPGESDAWTAVIRDTSGVGVASEMVATLYDASLDTFDPRDVPDLNGYFEWETDQSFFDPEFSDEFGEIDGYWEWDWAGSWGGHYQYRCFSTPEILQVKNGESARSTSSRKSIVSTPTRHAMCGSSVGALGGSYTPIYEPGIPTNISGGKTDDSPIARNAPAALIAARKNLQETAFFYPNLTSNDKGEVRISFTMPEALTRWRFIGFAHDNEMRSGTLEGETVTAKDLMVQPNPPRFLREGDMLDFTVKITNQSDKEQIGTAHLILTESATLKDANAALGVARPERAWTIPAKESRTLLWRLTVPDGAGFLNYKATATCGSLSDGEEGWLPVIPRRIMLTESMALPIRDAGSRDFTFEKLLDSGKSNTLENRLVHVQVVSQPAWYAVMALPYLMEFPHECAEQTFQRYYANALARHIATSDPRIRRVFDQWKNTPALDSPLAKDSGLKGILLEETPWLAEANEQSQARRKLGVLFDDNRLEYELDQALEKFKEMQRADGLWPWFSGGPANEHISLCIATGLARLRAMGVETDITPALNAMPAFDAILTKSFGAVQLEEKLHPGTINKNHLDPTVANILYTRTLFMKDCKLAPADQAAFDFFVGQAKTHWTNLDSRMSRAHIALALKRMGDLKTAGIITRSLRENATSVEETGMFWRDVEGESAWYWWQAPIETQAMMIEAFREIDHDEKAVDACQVWLIKQKQVRDWRTTTGTADAIHALLSGGRDLLASAEPLQVSLGGSTIKPDRLGPGTGFYEARIAGPAVKPDMGRINLTKTDPGVAWAGVHWQYLEDIAKVSGHQSGALKLEKTIFVRKATPQGPKLEPVTGPVRVGDELVTRLVLRNDRAMEFVHIKDSRGSGTEPLNVLSGYRYQDGLGYYEVTRDTASHFFIDSLPAGTHVFETSVRVQHAGSYQTGIAEIRCMYAPEFAAHSASVAVSVEN